MMRDLPPDLDERLLAWGRYFRDRARWGKCASAEGNYKPHSDDYAIEGWDKPVAPQTHPGRSRSVLEAIQTNDAVMQLNGVQKWALTYFFCYPNLPRFVVLKAIKKFAGRRISWKEYLDQVDLGRIRVHAILS